MKKLFIGIGILILLMPVYMCFDPASTYFMPKCIFYHLTGWECPACGIQRAIYALLHGDFMKAIGYNYFLLVSVPYFVAVAITTFCKGTAIEKACFYVQHPLTVKTILVLTMIWWVIRNIL